MTTRSILVGLGSGIATGYAIARALEAAREWRDPSPAVAKDAGAYARTRRALEVVDTLRGTAGFLAFAYGPLARGVDRATRFAPPWLRPALYIVPLSLLSASIDLPTAFVQEYTLERRFGLSEQTRSDWLEDYVKSALLSTALTALVSTLFGFALRRAPRLWPLLASAGAFPLLVIGNLIVPLYVMPLFNKFEPVTGSLEERLRRLAARFGVGDAEILRMDMSRQTRKANAFVTGVGHTHRIVLGDTLIEAFPENETEFVVAHELGHYVSADTWRAIAVGEALAVSLFLIANATTSPQEREALRDRPLLVVRLYATMLVTMQAFRPLLLAFSRSREWAADRFALDATRDASAGASAFRRLRDQNLADEDPPPWYELFFSSHPSLRARIDALEGSA
ncbi:MAG: M48 family metallopeptidase [Candidatus Baltobacteraceae bacterium]